MPKCPENIRDNEYKIVTAINIILKADPYFISKFTNINIPDFNIYSSSLLFKTVNTIEDDIDGTERALAVYFPNIVDFEIYQNWEKPKPTIYIECMVKSAHKDFGEEPARKECFQLLKDIKYTLEQNKNLRVLIPNSETNLDEFFQVGFFNVKNIEPLQMGSFNTNFWTCISLMELEIFTA